MFNVNCYTSRFKYDELKETGKKIYYLAGIPNDIEKGSTWTLYRHIADRISQNSTVNRQKQVDGKNTLKFQPIVFWFLAFFSNGLAVYWKISIFGILVSNANNVCPQNVSFDGKV